jgi:hypothetical protein
MTEIKKHGAIVSKTASNKPKNYYRSGVSYDDIRLALKSRGWLRLFQVAFLVGEKIPPESKARCAQLHRSKSLKHHSIDQLMVFGLCDLLRVKLNQMTYEGKVEKNGSGKDAEYRWKSEVDTTRQDKAGRRHTVKEVAE